MRPLIDLTDLEQQPSVFDQSTDSFTEAFANEFSSSDAQQATLDSQTPGVAAALDPIGALLDSIDGLLSAGENILDLLSGDLDAVDLTPDILNFQAADSALDAGLSGITFDYTDVATFFDDFFSFTFGQTVDYVINLFNPEFSQLYSALTTIESLLFGGQNISQVS
jgi:hypothetical protein